MWNLSYRWQRQLRLAAGGLVLCAAVVGSFLLAGTAPALRARAGARDLVDELRAPAEQFIEATLPAELQAAPGTLVYLDREDGIAQVTGRVVDVQPAQRGNVATRIRLMGRGAAERPSGVLRGASADLDLRNAVSLLIRPNTPEEEALRARDAIWPSVRTHVLPEMTEGLIQEISKELVSLDADEQAVFAKSFARLRTELRPLEDQLVDRLARRAWDVVGVKGLASGIWRSTAEDLTNRGTLMTDWWWQMLGKKSDQKPTAPEAKASFLSDETNEALQAALKDEALSFWKEHREEIVAALATAFREGGSDFEAAFRDRWATQLYERAVLPAWQSGQDQVLESVQVYANDFASRRLLTKQGGPRLLFAYALRSSLKISAAPLLVFTPGAGDGSGRVVYEPLLR
jgi:hypothetical protein